VSAPEPGLTCRRPGNHDPCRAGAPCLTPFGFFPWTFDAALVHLRAQGRLGVVPGWHTRHVARTHAVYYRDSRGAEPVDQFLQALPPKRAAKIDDFVAEHLNDRPAGEPPAGFPITSQIGGELRELRVRFADTSSRILYQRSDPNPRVERRNATACS